MVMSVSELAQIPHLRMRLLAGSAGSDRTVAWAHASDLDAPWNWLAGGELLMKNGRTLPSDAAARVELLDKLAEVDASALVIGEDPDTPPHTAEFLDAANSLAVPVLTIPYAVSFVSVSRAVADASALDDARRIARTERIYEIVRSAAGRSESFDFLRRLEEELKCRLFLLDSIDARPVLKSSHEPTPALRRAVREAVGAHRGSVPALLRLALHDDKSALAVEVPYAEPTVLVAVDFSGGSLDVALLEHAATAVAVEVVYVSLQRELERRSGTELLAHLVDTRLNYADACNGLTDVGLDAETTVVLNIRDCDEQAWADLHISLNRRHIAHLLLRRGDDRLALVPDSMDGFNLIQRRLGPAVILGVSDTIFNPLRIAEAVKEARMALAEAATRTDRRARYADTKSTMHYRDVNQAERIVERVLGPLLAYDAGNETNLVATTQTFLTCRRSWQRTAAELNLHKQTVVYRIHRVEELTGLDLGDTSDIVAVWSALQAYKILNGVDPDTGGSGS